MKKLIRKKDGKLFIIFTDEEQKIYNVNEGDIVDILLEGDTVDNYFPEDDNLDDETSVEEDSDSSDEEDSDDENVTIKDIKNDINEEILK